MSGESKGTILIFCGHNDDQIIGCGGTLSNYSKEGYTIKTIIFSYGAGSHPHLQKDIIIKTRVSESLRSDNILGGSGIAYFGLAEARMAAEIKKKHIREKVRFIITRERPVKIFTHSMDDPHPDHRTVYRLVKDVVEELPFDVEVWTFDVWNIVSVKRHQQPRLVVDISKSFATKMKALRVHKSQQTAIWALAWNIYMRAITAGWDYGYRYAEIFYRM
jgi:LmbE family N-acetylglucosaminyl deacetylase